MAHERRLLLLSASAPRSSFHYLCRPLSTSGSGSVFDVIPAGTTLSKQGDLEHYGVPNLRETAEKLVASSEHLLTPEELASTKRKTKELVEGQAGKRLQQLLVQRAKDNENWVGRSCRRRNNGHVNGLVQQQFSSLPTGGWTTPISVIATPS